jgi:hypothetical protein
MNLEMEGIFDYNDDWEKAIIPDLISEREKILIEDRKKVEEADNNLTEELFSGKKITENNKSVIVNASIILDKKEKPKFRRENLIETQKQKSESIKRKKLEQKRLNEIYGEAAVDEYYEMYGAIQDKY